MFEEGFPFATHFGFEEPAEFDSEGGVDLTSVDEEGAERGDWIDGVYCCY